MPLTNRLFNLLMEQRHNSGIVFTYNGGPISSIARAGSAVLNAPGFATSAFTICDTRSTRASWRPA